MTEDTKKMKQYESIVERLSFAAINEQRRARRWKIFFTFILFLYLTPLFLLMLDLNDINLLELDKQKNGQHTAVVKLEGVISAGDEANAENIINGLNDAFDDENTAGVILSINSPGGSPVQSSYIYDEMIRLRKEHPDTPLYVVVSDMAASGGYFIASAAENIYVNKSSIVGSIGVRMDGFGFVGLMEKMGVERRLLTAGENKGLLDPFLPENQVQKEHLKLMLSEVHTHFKQAVIEGRGDRLKITDDVFSGLVWTGERGIDMGLVDAYGNVDSVAKDIIKAEDVVDFTPKKLLFDRLATKISASISQQLKLFMTQSIKLQ